MSDLFYAVCSGSSVCGVKSDTFKSLKAVFSNKTDAELLVKDNSDMDLIVIPIYITDARK